jgi:hypothetical protein
MEAIRSGFRRNQLAFPAHGKFGAGDVFRPAGVPEQIDVGLDLFVNQLFEIRIAIISGRQARLAVFGLKVFRRYQDAVLRRPMDHVLRYRTNHDGRSKHELIVNAIGLFIGGKIHRQAAHDCVAAVGHLPGQRINVGHQAVAQVVEFDEDIGELAELPDFARGFRAVRPEDGGKRAQLKHAGIKFLVGGVLAAVGKHPFVTADVESADIKRPIRNPGHAMVQAGRDLFFVNIPVRADVARPRGGGGALLAGEG